MRVSSCGRCAFAICLVIILTAGATPGARADTLTTGAANYRAYALARITSALQGAEQLLSAVAKGDAKAAQGAWIASREGWERIEPITGEFFEELDSAIDSWPDAEHGYHAIEAPLFSSKLDGLQSATAELVKNLKTFRDELAAPGLVLTPQGLLDGTAGLAYEIGEKKAQGGESPYAGTSLRDMQENIEGIKAAYQLAFQTVLKAKDAKLAAAIADQIEMVKNIIDAPDLKQLDQAALRKQSETLAIMMQSAAPLLGLKQPELGK